MSKKPSGEAVGKLATGIMFFYKFEEPRKVITVQPPHICFVETLAKLPQVGTSPDLFN